MTHTPQKKYNIIFGKMSSADFYPKGRNNEIDVIIAAPKDTKVFAGNVVVIDKEIYQELLEILRECLKDYKIGFAALREQELIQPILDSLRQATLRIQNIEAAISKLEDK